MSRVSACDAWEIPSRSIAGEMAALPVEGTGHAPLGSPMAPAVGALQHGTRVKRLSDATPRDSQRLDGASPAPPATPALCSALSDL